MTGVANLHTVWTYGVGLCVRCKSCDTRKVVAGDKLDAHRGNMTRVRDLRLKCSACGATDNIERIIPPSKAAADRFLAGADIESASTV